MHEQIKQLIDETRRAYGGILTGKDSRILLGPVLWDQFESAANGCLLEVEGADSQLGERINELAVAKLLADDAGIASPITYEPDMLASGRRFILSPTVYGTIST